MIDLLSLQQSFQHYLLSDNACDVTKYLHNTGNASIETRLQIYNHAYKSRLIDALSANFPNLKITLGIDEFNHLCHQYRLFNPSTFRSIRWFGHQFADFIKNYYPNESRDCLAEIATLDWTMACVFDAEDAETLTPHELANISAETWPDLSFSFHPSLHLRTFQWNVVQCSMEKEQTPQSNQLLCLESPGYWLFWRRNLTSQYASIAFEEFSALQMAINKHNFGEICDHLCQYIDESDVALYAASSLKKWLISGIITEIRS